MRCSARARSDRRGLWSCERLETRGQRLFTEARAEKLETGSRCIIFAVAYSFYVGRTIHGSFALHCSSDHNPDQVLILPISI